MTMTLDQQLRQAASQGDLSAVNEALTQGADVNAREEFGDTALNLAADSGHLDVVERLLEAGTDLENLGGADLTPLMNATFSGNVKVVEVLLSRGARISHDLLSSLQMKVNILEENAEAGMVNPEAAQAWRGFLDYMVEAWQEQNPSEEE